MKKRKIISLAMACICAITSFSLPVINVSAAETENVTETLSIDSDEIEEQKTEDCIVNADISGSFTITIPKKMILSGNDKKGSYEVTAKGDIAATEVINVVPEEKFVLSSTGKEDVETSVSQLKKAFSYSDVMKTEDGILVGSTTSGEVTSDNLTSGEWKGSFYFNINMAKVSKISVIAKDDSKTDLNASAYTIEGVEKEELLNALITSGVTDISSTEEVDALIEIESDAFDNIAEATFTVSNIADDGDTVVILHYNEETGEWEYIGAYEVVDGEVTADFTSFSPVAFVVVQSDGTLHIHEYVVTEEVEATCTTGGSKVYTCECGDSYTEEIEALGHTVGAETCPVCGDEIEYTAFALGSSNYSQAGITREGDVVIPQYFEYNGTYYEVTSIGYGAFQNCTALTELTISDSVTSIGDNAFNDCRSLANITIPDSVTSIGTNAFCGCSSLSSITIPDSVTSISNSLFAGCTGLTSITIPDSVTSIGNQAFSQCISLTNITIPDSVTSIGNSAFESCMSLKSIEIPDSVISIGNRTFYNCTSLTNIVIPNSVTSIGNSAFFTCVSLTNIDIPDSVTSIGGSAFRGCTELTSISIPDGVKSIGDSTFYDCTSLTSVEIPNSVTSIATNAFYGCTTLTSVYIPNSVTTISASKYSYSPFYKCSSSLKIYCGASAKQSGWGTYWNYYSSSGTLSVTYSYPKEAYEFYSQLSSDATEVVIPDGITIIPNNAFYGFKSLTSVTIPDSVTSIGNSAFYNCTSLTDVTIPDSVTSIGEKAFYGCTALTTIYIPSSVTTMVGYSSGINPFYYCSPSLKIYCEVSAKQSGWGGYWNYYSSSKTLSVTYGVTREEYEASYGFYLQLSSDVTEITIPDGITVIPDNAFYGFKNLTKVEIPNSVTSIATNAFYGCTTLTSVYIPNSVTTISASSYSYSPFYNCSSSLKIYCGASEAQSGWGTYWNYRNSSTKLSVTYGVTREEYETNYK